MDDVGGTFYSLSPVAHTISGPFVFLQETRMGNFLSFFLQSLAFGTLLCGVSFLCPNIQLKVPQSPLTN